MSNGVFIVAAKRTPFGSFGGSLRNITPTQLGVISTKAAIQQLQSQSRLSLPSDDEENAASNIIDTIYFGNINPSSADSPYLARHVGLQSGCNITTPAVTLNRACGSGFESIIQGMNAIKIGDANVVLCGGSENMSMAPIQIDGNSIRWNVPLGKGLLARDGLWAGLNDDYVPISMGMTAENLAQQYSISRLECDEFALRSQKNWKAAYDKGIFDMEIAPVEIPSKNGTTTIFDTDEHPRPDVTIEKLSKLKPVFQKDGVVTAANASGICDGAGSIIVASEKAIEKYNLKPLARIVSYGITGCDPKIMGIGPVSAIQQAIQRAGVTAGDGGGGGGGGGVVTSIHNVDRIEINEAFAAQFLACAKELDIDMNKTNIHGGAISMGHPTGASGSRIIAHLAHEFHRKDNTANLSIGAACIGGGQGIAVLLEKA